MLMTRQFSAFLKSAQANAAPPEKMAQETTDAVGRTEEAVKETTNAIARAEAAVRETTEAIASTKKAIEETQAEVVQQAQTLSGFTLVTTAFLPLGFCTSVFHLLSVL